MNKRLGRLIRAAEEQRFTDGQLLDAMGAHMEDDEFWAGVTEDLNSAIDAALAKVADDPDADALDALRVELEVADLENGFGYLVGAAEEDLGAEFTVAESNRCTDLYDELVRGQLGHDTAVDFMLDNVEEADDDRLEALREHAQGDVWDDEEREFWDEVMDDV